MFCKFLSVFASPCEIRAFKTGLVCVCNSTNCDTLEFNLPGNGGEVLILSTSQSGLRFHETRANFNHDKITIPHGHYHFPSSNLEIAATIFKLPPLFPDPIGSIVNISFNRSATYQKIIGFGGAFTGAVSENLKKLESDELRRHVYRSYYSKEVGNGYSLLRFPIGGCDFDLEPWAYNESPEHDPYLTKFNSLDPRDLEKIEQINEMKKIARNTDIKVFGAAWSPPPWMKTNGEWTGFSALRDEYYQTWADYHVKYLELMNERNFSFWSISTGNEPMNGVIFPYFVHFMSLGWLPKDQARWLSQNLGPSLRKSPTAFNVKILAGDDQRYTFPWWFDQMYEESPDVSQFIDGFAVHWYADRYSNPEVLDKSYEKFHGKFIIASEACSGDKPWDIHKPIMGSWGRAQDYIIDIIENLNHRVSAWVDWNLILDTQGGPNYAHNYVDAPIIANGTEILKQPIFYAMGHFSRFIVPDSIRLYSKSSDKLIKTTVFLRPDGYVVVVLYNM